MRFLLAGFHEAQAEALGPGVVDQTLNELRITTGGDAMLTPPTRANHDPAVTAKLYEFTT